MKTLLIAVVTAVALLAPTLANANTFATVGAACVPDASDLTNPTNAYTDFVQSSGTVKHLSSFTGLLIFYCPITTEITTPTHVELLYQDSTSSAGNNVKASYIKMNASSGVITTISTADSNSGSVTSGSPAIVFTTFSDTYDPTVYRYYVRVDLTRSSTVNNEIFYGVSVY